MGDEVFRRHVWAAIVSTIWAAGACESLAAGQARALYDETSLKAAETIIVAPERYMGLARKVASEIKSAVGEELTVKLDTTVAADDWKRYHMLLLGSMASNRAMLRVYQEHRCAVDAIYPGKGGYVVRTSDDPFGYRRNVILLGGSDTKGVTDAVARFSKALRKTGLLDEQQKKIGRLFLVKTDVRTTLPGHDPLMLYYMTGDKDLRPRFLRRSWDPGGGKGLTFRGFYTFLPWYYLDYGPGMSPGQRDKATRQILDSLNRLAAANRAGARFKPDPRSPGRLLHNYEVNSGYNAWLVAHYADKYFRQNKGTWPHLQSFGAWLDQQLFCYRTSDGCLGYHGWMAMLKLLDYYAMSGKMATFIENGQMQLLGDLAIVAVDNLGMDLCTGEQTAYGQRMLMWSQGLRMAAAHLDNGGEQNWFLHYCKQFQYRGARGISYPRNLYTGSGHRLMGMYMTDKQPVKPTRLLGVHALGLGRFHPSTCRAYGNIPPEQFFDKTTFRRDFSKDAEYLCLEGPEVGFLHREFDSNSILRLTWNDRTWLCVQTMGYVGGRPTPTQFRNAAWPGREQARNARMIALGNFEHTGLTTTRTEYAQATWNRHVFWDKADLFLVLDDLVAKKPGRMTGTCRWESMGKASLDPERGVFAVEQGGPKFFIIGDDGSTRSLAVQRRRGSKGEPVHYGPRLDLGSFPTFGSPNLSPADPWPKVLTERQTREMKVGEVMRFSNLLWSVKARERRRFGIKKLDEAAFVISTGTKKALAGAGHAGSYARDGLRIDAGAFYIKSGYLAATRCKAIEIGGTSILKSDTPIEVEIDWGDRRGRLSVTLWRKRAQLVLADGITCQGATRVGLSPGEPRELKVNGTAPPALSGLLGTLPAVEPIQ